MAKASNLIHVFDTFYVFQNKEKEIVRVFTRDDIPAADIQTRYNIGSEYIFKGIFENKTNKFLSKEPSFIAKELPEIESSQPKTVSQNMMEVSPSKEDSTIHLTDTPLPDIVLGTDENR